MDVKVSPGTFAKLFADYSAKVQAGKKTLGDARKALEDAERDGLADAPQGPQSTTDQRGRQRVTFGDPADADRSTKAAKVAVRRPRDILAKALDVHPARIGDDADLCIGGAELATKMAAFQRLSDGLLFCSAMLRDEDGNAFNPRASKHYPALQRLAGEIVGKILTTTGSATGAEYVPTMLSGQLIELYRTKLQVAALFPRFTIPRGVGTYDLPLEGADVDPYLVAQAADDNPAGVSTNEIPARTPGTGKVSFLPIGMKVRLLVSTEATEDSIIEMVDYLRNKGVMALVSGTEGAIINGDTTATHRDSDITGATNYLKAWDGLRDLSNSEAKISVASASGGKLLGVHFINLRTKFGKYADDPSRLVNIVSVIGAAHLTGDPNFTTIDKMGPNASLVTGQVGVVLGSPVVVSSKVRNNLNASGDYDGVTTTKTIAVTVHRDCFALADKRSITVESEKDIQTDKWIVVCTMRQAFKRVHAEGSAERNVGVLLGINASATFL